MTEQQSGPGKVLVDKTRLYRQEEFTDLSDMVIARFSPITPNGEDDSGRTPFYMGRTQLMTPDGLIPVQCSIEASSLEEAFDNFPSAMDKMVERIVKQAQEKNSSAPA